MASDSITSSKATVINWNESWKELDLVFGTAISNDSSEVLLDPSNYGVTPHGGVQFADVALLGSDSANRVYASFDNYINTKGGNDTLFSIDDYTGNQIVGGTGSDTFFLQATDNLILGGEIFADSDSHDLSNNVALTDFEADAFLVASSSKQVSLGQDLKIHDFEVNRDSVSIDGLKIDASDWTAARDLLSTNKIDINATPESILERITISLLEGVTTNTDLAPFILDRDNDSLRVIKITGPDWITVSGTVITANTPYGETEEDLQAIDLQIGYTDEKVVSPFSAHLTLNKAPTTLELTDDTTSLVENTDTSQPIKLADISITDDALGSNIITLSGDDAAAFEVSGNALLLKAGTTLDFETKSSYDINVNVADPDLTTSTPISTPFSLTLTDVNEPPTALELTVVTTSLVENTDTSQPIKLADISITDDALGSNIITLSGDDAAAFEVSGNALLLKAGTTLDFETKSSYDINVNVADPDLTTSTPISTPFSLTLTDVNDSPTGGVTISGTATQGETLTADISEIADADGLGDFSYQWKADGADITGATAKTFVPTQDQVGKAITVAVSYTDGGGTAESLTSAATAAVTTTPVLTVNSGETDSPGTVVINPASIPEGETLVISSSDLPEGTQPVFEISGGVVSPAILAIDFQNIDPSSTPIDPSLATDGGGTIASNAPQNLTLSLDGVYLNSGAGADSITGSQHNDFLRAGAGDDIIDSGAGDDLVRAGAGNDQITLGSGNDMLYFTADQLDQSIDTLNDFNSAEDIIALGENITVSLAGNSNIATFTTEIDGLERSSQLIFSGLDTITEEWFIFG